jgi:hypothetical protein
MATTPDLPDPADRRTRSLWVGWAALTLALGGYAAVAFALHGRADAPLATPLRVALLPGATTDGHHQIELACPACHRSAFGGGEVLQQACTGCHAQALEAGDDKHPARKFEDPRNAFRLEKIDATRCVTCHVEHRPKATRAMGVTQPADYCFHCHGGKDEMPPSHAGLPFDGCTACHNYHDNRALYEDYLLRHARAPALLERPVVPVRALLEALQMSAAYPHDRFPFGPVAPARADAPAAWRQGPQAARHAEALDTTHARAGVNCSGCHRHGGPAAGWVARPATPQACEGCHADEVRGFRGGRHGMRAAAGLAPMTPAGARLPMQADAAHRALQCTSCHGAHGFAANLAAAVQACLGCHDDEHSRAYQDSPHHVLAQREARGELPPGSGVSCATCHMPRERIDTAEGTRIAVQHNQSATMRPFSKMVRPVCQHCHGLGFVLDALSDRVLVARNFRGRPAATHRSIAMALDKSAAVAARRAAAAAAAPASQPR